MPFFEWRGGKMYSVWHVPQFGLNQKKIGFFQTLEEAKTYAAGLSTVEDGIYTVYDDEGDLNKVPADIPPMKAVYEIEHGHVVRVA